MPPVRGQTQAIWYGSTPTSSEVAVGDVWVDTSTWKWRYASSIGPVVWTDMNGGAASVSWGSITGTLSTQADLQTALNAKEATANKGVASGYAGLDGSTKVPIAQLPTGSSSTTVCIGNDSRLSDARTPTAHTHPESDVVNLTTDLAAKEATANKGAAGGYAALDSNKLVPFGQVNTWTKRLILSGTDRSTLAGSYDYSIVDQGVPVIGTPKANSSFILPNDYQADFLRRLTLTNNNRATLNGSSDLYIVDDFGTRQRIVLSG